MNSKQWKKAYSKARYADKNPGTDFVCQGREEIVLFTTALALIDKQKPKPPKYKGIFALLD